MTPEDMAILIHQHDQILVQFERIWLLLIVIAVIGILIVAIILVAAAWSVSRVLNRQVAIEANQTDLAGKFSLLIDVLLRTERNRRGDSDPV